MRNSNTSRIARRLPWAGYGALALGPFVGGLACSVYDTSLLGDMTAPLGGSGKSAGAAGSGGVGGSAIAGEDTGGSASVSAGATSGGKAGESSTTAGSGGSAGTSNGGSGGTASAGAAGSAGAGGTVEPGATESIDDMEDGDPEIVVSGGRNGYWYAGGDLTVGATTDPPSTKYAMAQLAASDRSTYAAHLKAVGFNDWGSVMGFNFTEQSGVKPYDASAFCGVQFWGKAAAATNVRVRIPDIDTHQEGMVCKPVGAAGTACYDHFGAQAAFTTAWKSFTIKFTDVMQIGTGYHPADGKIKTAKLFALEWALPGLGKTWEIWVDDVEFIKCK